MTAMTALDRVGTLRTLRLSTMDTRTQTSRRCGHCGAGERGHRSRTADTLGWTSWRTSDSATHGAEDSRSSSPGRPRVAGLRCGDAGVHGRPARDTRGPWTCLADTVDADVRTPGPLRPATSPPGVAVGIDSRQGQVHGHTLGWVRSACHRHPQGDGGGMCTRGGRRGTVARRPMTRSGPVPVVEVEDPTADGTARSVDAALADDADPAQSLTAVGSSQVVG